MYMKPSFSMSVKLTKVAITNVLTLVYVHVEIRLWIRHEDFFVVFRRPLSADDDVDAEPYLE